MDYHKTISFFVLFLAAGTLQGCWHLPTVISPQIHLTVNDSDGTPIQGLTVIRSIAYGHEDEVDEFTTDENGVILMPLEIRWTPFAFIEYAIGGGHSYSLLKKMEFDIKLRNYQEIKIGYGVEYTILGGRFWESPGDAAMTSRHWRWGSGRP